MCSVTAYLRLNCPNHFLASTAHRGTHFTHDYASYELSYTFNISTGLLEHTIGLPTMNGFMAQWLEYLSRHRRGPGFESRIESRLDFFW